MRRSSVVCRCLGVRSKACEQEATRKYMQICKEKQTKEGRRRERKAKSNGVMECNAREMVRKEIVEWKLAQHNDINKSNSAA